MSTHSTTKEITMARKRVTLLDTLAKLKHTEEINQSLFQDVETLKKHIRNRDETITGLKKETVRLGTLVSDLGKELDRRRRPTRPETTIPDGAMILIPADSEMGREIEKLGAGVVAARENLKTPAQDAAKGNGLHAH